MLSFFLFFKDFVVALNESTAQYIFRPVSSAVLGVLASANTEMCLLTSSYSSDAGLFSLGSKRSLFSFTKLMYAPISVAISAVLSPLIVSSVAQAPNFEIVLWIDFVAV